MKAIRIRQVMGISLSVLACVMFTQTGFARVVQGFESGDPAVSGDGDASVQGTFEGQAPPQGSNQYLLTTIRTGDGDGLSPVSGTNAVTNASLGTFFNGLSLLGTEGSGVLIPFAVLAGDTTMTLQYDFLSNEPGQDVPHNDFAFDAIFNSSNTLVGSVSNFATESGSSFTLFGPESPFIFHTGLQTLTLNISGLAPGNYNLGIGVEDKTTTDGNSGLLLDNVQIGSVPEPSAIAFCIAGAVLLAALRTQIKRRSY